MADPARLATWLRARGPAVAADIVVNFVGPYVIYAVAAPHWGDVRALLASSLPPILWSLAEFIRHRRLDALSVIVLAGIALSLLAFFGGGGPRMLQLREKLVTGVIGVAFLVSAAVGRPLIFELAKAGMARRGDDAGGFAAKAGHPRFRRTMTLMTIVWGVALIADVAIGAVLVFTLTIKQYLIVNPIEGYAVLGAASLWTFWYARRAEARGKAAAPPA